MLSIVTLMETGFSRTMWQHPPWAVKGRGECRAGGRGEGRDEGQEGVRRGEGCGGMRLGGVGCGGRKEGDGRAMGQGRQWEGIAFFLPGSEPEIPWNSRLLQGLQGCMHRRPWQVQVWLHRAPDHESRQVDPPRVG